MKLISYSILLLLLVLSSCDKGFDLEPTSYQQIDTRSGRVAGREILVMDISQTRQKGKLNNPYYVGSIRNAYNYLKSSDQITGTYNITPNRLYIRYLPKNEEELYLLETSENFEVFEYPLQDNDLLATAGHGYDDPELAEGQLPFQYTVCGFGEIEAGIEVDILDSLFLNEPNPTIPGEDWRKI